MLPYLFKDISFAAELLDLSFSDDLKMEAPVQLVRKRYPSLVVLQISVSFPLQRL